MAAPGDALQAAFDDPVHASQRVFRHLLDAMARPGRVVRIDDRPALAGDAGPVAMAALALALFDYETPVWLDPAAAALRDGLVFHCGCPIVEDPSRAAFALVGAPTALADLDAFCDGSDEHPERGATVVLEVNGLAGDRGRRLHGPGIDGSILLAVDGAPAGFWDRVRTNHATFPRGLDFVLTCADRLAAVPRSTRLED